MNDNPPNDSPFARELQRCMRDQGFTLERVARESRVAKSTLHHWLTGSVRKPYGWENVLKVAVAMNLSRLQVNRLLRSAGLPQVEQLAAGANHSMQRQLLAFWLPPDHANLR